jgi:hypothetical protein
MTKYSITQTWNNLAPFGRLLVGFFSLLLISCIAFSCFSSFIIILLPVSTLTPQATPTFTVSPSPEIRPTFTPLSSSSLTPFPTRRVYASTTPPIYIVTITNTPFPIVPTLSTIFPTLTPRVNVICPCDRDKLDCSDFSTRRKAQSCYDYCLSKGVGDIHELDDDGNGAACEDLP